ncbi:hypothetical protein ON010_g2572 [Phytophthora cinnamomi]|nr:hypothetical protein ON010_g2572 [Phytophthora cinnamomi]
MDETNATARNEKPTAPKMDSWCAPPAPVPASFLLPLLTWPSRGATRLTWHRCLLRYLPSLAYCREWSAGRICVAAWGATRSVRVQHPERSRSLEGLSLAHALELRHHAAGPRSQVAGLVDHLAVDRVLRHAHDDASFLGVDLGVEAGVADQVDDPLLGLAVLLHRQLGRQRLHVDGAVHAAVHLEDGQSGGIHEVRRVLLVQEEVAGQHDLALAQLLLGRLEVEVDEQALDEVHDRVAVALVVHAQHAQQVLDEVTTALVQDHAGAQVAQQPGRVALDGLYTARLQHKVHDGVTALLVPREDEQRPVQQPRALLELLHGAHNGLQRQKKSHKASARLDRETKSQEGAYAALDDVADARDVGERVVPAEDEDLGGQLAPERVESW